LCYACAGRWLAEAHWCSEYSIAPRWRALPNRRIAAEYSIAPVLDAL
jgi:hypothetical protein